MAEVRYLNMTETCQIAKSSKIFGQISILAEHQIGKLTMIFSQFQIFLIKIAYFLFSD